MKKILDYIQTLEITNKEKSILTEIFEVSNTLGHSEKSERMRVLKASLQFLGNSYRRTEELATDTVDCSTLTSQSYWEGAQIGIPFIAQSQRNALDGESVELLDVLPADIVVRFPDLESAPDKTYNHVGLVLGTDKGGKLYVIESNSKDGCIISTLEEFNPEGGFRRYIKNQNIETDDSLHSKFNAAAKKTPKLSRLGAKQYQKNVQDRVVHKGIDIYVRENTPVYAPISGVVSLIKLPDEKEPALVIDSEDGIRCILGNVEARLEMIGKRVKAEQEVGKVISIRGDTHMKYPEQRGLTTHIHFQVEGNIESDKVLNKIKIGDKTYYNGIYLAKIGLAKLPIK